MLMKRRFLMLVYFSVCLSIAHAQKLVEGSLEPLKSYGKAKISLDFSKAIIHGMTVEEFSEYEKDWEIDQPIIMTKFLSGLTDKCTTINFSLSSDSEISITIKVLTISTKGNYTCEVFVSNKHGDKIAHITELNAKGGTFGSKLNLIKDGAEHTGKQLGKFIKNQIKRIK